MPTLLPAEGLDGLAAEIIRFLDARGSAAGLRTALNEIEGYPEGLPWSQVIVRELTGGGAPEVIVAVEIPVYPMIGGVMVFACHSGGHRLAYLGELPIDSGLEIANVDDMTGDGLAEVVYSAVTGVGSGGLTTSFVIVGWTGSVFAQLLDERPIEAFNLAEAWIVDTDGSGTLELLLTGNVCACYPFEGPQRTRTDYWAWDGQKFERARWAYTAPEYRFQAVQDGDDATLFGDYDAALAFYQQAIYDPDLKGWSPAEPGAGMGETPLPPPDPAEWARLGAYARYRIMLLHASRGYLDAAQIVFEELQARFPMPRPGHPYAELAAAFWEEFSVGQDLTAACGRAVAYAEEHRAEILAPLGSEFYGVLNRSYAPEDVCPLG